MTVHSLELPQPEPDWFGSFWLLYPRREARKDALRAWAKINGSEYPAILQALVLWRNVWRQQNRSTHLIPLPATWLNGERWTDEIPPELQAHTAQHSPHSPVVVPSGSDIPRGSIPVSVQKVLDQMKARKP